MTGWTQTGGSVAVAGGEMVLASNAVTSRAEQSVAVTPGKTYRLTGSLKNANGSSWTYLGLSGSVSGVTNSQGTSNTEAGTNATSYTQGWVQFTASSSSVTVYASFYKNQPGSGYADQLSLVEVP